jgi:hypothetical protein
VRSGTRSSGSTPGATAALFDGCNAVGDLTWSLDRGRVVLGGDGVSTLVACPDLRPFLARTSALRLEGDGLVVLDADGARVGRLQRAAG